MGDPISAALAWIVANPGTTALAAGAGATAYGASQMDKLKAPKKKTMPTPDDKAAQAGRERQMQRRYGGMGREATALSESSNLG